MRRPNPGLFFWPRREQSARHPSVITKDHADVFPTALGSGHAHFYSPNPGIEQADARPLTRGEGKVVAFTLTPEYGKDHAPLLCPEAGQAHVSSPALQYCHAYAS